MVACSWTSANSVDTLKESRLVEMEMRRSFSSGSKSLAVVPALTDPRLEMAPAAASRASARVVLPLEPCPTKARL